MKCIPIIISCMIILHLVAMDRPVDNNRQAYIARLTQRIRDKEFEIQQCRIMRYAVEFTVPFLAHSIDQPYAAGVTAIGAAAICLLTHDIEDAVEIRDYLLQSLHR